MKQTNNDSLVVMYRKSASQSEDLIRFPCWVNESYQNT